MVWVPAAIRQLLSVRNDLGYVAQLCHFRSTIYTELYVSDTIVVVTKTLYVEYKYVI